MHILFTFAPNIDGSGKFMCCQLYHWNQLESRVMGPTANLDVTLKEKTVPLAGIKSSSPTVALLIEQSQLITVNIIILPYHSDERIQSKGVSDRSVKENR